MGQNKEPPQGERRLASEWKNYVRAMAPGKTESYKREHPEFSGASGAYSSKLESAIGCLQETFPHFLHFLTGIDLPLLHKAEKMKSWFLFETYFETRGS